MFSKKFNIAYFSRLNLTQIPMVLNLKRRKFQNLIAFQNKLWAEDYGSKCNLYENCEILHLKLVLLHVVGFR